MADGSGEGGAPAWLFSFVDLAFLMLIAMTILASQNAGAPDFGEMQVPRIGEEKSDGLAAGRGEVLQLRVHAMDEQAPFELILTGTMIDASEPTGADLRLELDALDAALVAAHAAGAPKPLLAPHEDSRSQDLLDAASSIEALWPSQRRAVVARLADR
jgi:hypothetical protein